MWREGAGAGPGPGPGLELCPSETSDLTSVIKEIAAGARDGTSNIWKNTIHHHNASWSLLNLGDIHFVYCTSYNAVRYTTCAIKANQYLRFLLVSSPCQTSIFSIILRLLGILVRSCMRCGYQNLQAELQRLKTFCWGFSAHAPAN